MGVSLVVYLVKVMDPSKDTGKVLLENSGN